MVSKNKQVRITPMSSNREDKRAKYNKSSKAFMLPVKTVGGGNCEVCNDQRAQAWKLPSGERVVLCHRCRFSIEINLND